MNTKKHQATMISPFEIAGFTNVEFIKPNPNSIPQAVIFALNIHNERIGMARIPAQEYSKAPENNIRQMKAFLYEVTSWLAEAKAKQLAAERAQAMEA